MFQQPNDNLPARLLTCFYTFRRSPWHIHRIPAPGLSSTETGILIGIERFAMRGSKLRILDLSHMMRVSSPTITQHINNLESQGFVEKTQAEDDKRAVNLSLTEKGHHALRQHRSALEQNCQELVDHLGKENAELLIDLLTKTADFFIEKEKSYSYENDLERG